MAKRTLDGKVVVITGASSGFGKGAALRFAEERASVVLAARRGDLLEEIAARCRESGVRASAVATDVSRPEDVERLANHSLREHGRIDVWVNNAGVGALGPFERIPLEAHRQVIATNLLGTLHGSFFAYRHFRERRAGILINVASELGGHTVPYYSSYAAAKHGIVGLGDSLRQEIALAGLDDVHVCTLMPSAHDTPFFDHAANYTGHEIQAPAPLHDPQDVVETLVRLALDPKDREIVGSDGLVKILMKKVMPGVQDRLAARMMHRTQMEQAPPARDAPNALYEPVPRGTDVGAGRR
jgi:NAD(P)-dependent dehydrogenase (short-subunit alcohol dehydrogenase family)